MESTSINVLGQPNLSHKTQRVKIQTNKVRAASSTALEVAEAYLVTAIPNAL